GTICVAGGACPPSGELVSITIDEVLQKAAIGQNGAFSVSFPTATIPASTTPYPVTYSYGGDPNFHSAAGTGQPLTVNQATPVFTNLTTMPSSITYGTASVTVSGTICVAGGACPPSGELVSITIDKVLQKAAIGQNGAFSVSFPTATIPASTTPYPVTYSYGGDPNFHSAAGTGQPLTVNQATPVFTNLTTTPSSITYGTASVTVSGTICVAGGACPPSGELVSITIDEALQKAAIGQNGAFSVSFPTATIPASTTPYPVTYSYGGDRNFHSASGTGQPLTVNQANTTVALTSIPNPSSYGQPVTITATVTGAFGGSPSGTVNFTDNGVAIKGCSGITLNAGVATCQTSTLTVGTHANIVATYSGNNNYNGSNSTLQPAQVVNKAATTVVLTSAPNPSSYGQAVTITATVTGAFGGSPTGTVTFTDNDLPIAGCSGVVLVAQTNGSMATCQTSTLSVGTHAGITAPYSGDTNYNGSNSTLQPAQLVNKAATTIVLTSAPNPSIYGQPVTITATATGAFGGSPTGTINFTDNGVAIPGCSAVVLVAQTNGSVGACQTSTLSVGTHNQIKTQYGGDQNYLGGNSTLNPGQVVEGAPTTTTLTAHPNPANFGQPVTFTATVTTRGGAFASGSVTFQSNGVNIPDCPNPATLVNGVASCTTQSLSGGSDTILASFNDPQGFYGPSSATLTEQVGDFTVLPISPSGAIVVQSFSNIDEPFFAQAINVTVQPLMGYNNTVSLSCSVSPVLAGGSCVVNAPASGSLAGGNLSTTLTISAGSTTPIGSYTVTVTGQDNTGLVHSATLTLTVINYTATITMPSGGGGRTKVIFPGPAGTPITNLSCPQVSGTGIAGTEDLSLIGGVCTFTPTSVDLPAPVLITISGCTVARLRTHMPIFASFLFGIPGIVLLGSLHGGWRRRKRMLRMVAFLLVALSLLLGVGCGGYGQLSPTGNYSVLVQGTGPDGTVYSAVVPVTVTPLNQ
ncbi:MAG: Ig-like domain-containing protein, partial [Candidatus Korobacteraceae bacterium]